MPSVEYFDGAEREIERRKMEPIDSEAMLQGQAEIWQYMLNFADSMALKCAVELRLADIIHSHGCPITLSQIASCIDFPFPDITCLSRIMRLLVRKKIFTASFRSDDGEIIYGLTHSSKWILHDAELSLAPMLLMHNHQWALEPWHFLSDCVREGGGVAFKKAHGHEIFDFASINPEFNTVFNNAMKCGAKITTRAILAGYKDGFSRIESLVDVGGGTGAAISEIVKAYPHIKGINFDLRHVITTAPEYAGVSHVQGEMFEAIPKADAVFMKWVLHDSNDEHCVKILQNCRKSVSQVNGKVIIVDVVLEPHGDDLFYNTGIVFDLLMMAHSSGGKERTEPEWKKILEGGGFPCYKIIKIPAFLSIIEAFPE